MACDLDRRCAAMEQRADETIARLDRILRNPRLGSRRQAILQYRNDQIIELHDMRRAHDAYDRRREEADEDPTGQDSDNFYANHCEDSGSRFNDAGEPLW